MAGTDTSLPFDHFLPGTAPDARAEATENFIVGDENQHEGRRGARRRASRTKRRSPEGRLARALAHGTGHVAVIGRNVGDAGRLLDDVVDTVGAHRVVHVPASADSAAIARALLDDTDEHDWADANSATARRTALSGVLQNARRARSPIVVVADGADAATVEELDRLRLALEFAPGALGTVKLVLLGTPSLERTLSKTSARGLASRICARVQAPDTSPSRTAVALRSRFAAVSWPSRVVTLATVAVASVALLAPLVVRSPPAGTDAASPPTEVDRPSVRSGESPSPRASVAPVPVPAKLALAGGGLVVEARGSRDLSRAESARARVASIRTPSAAAAPARVGTAAPGPADTVAPARVGTAAPAPVDTAASTPGGQRPSVRDVARQARQTTVPHAQLASAEPSRRRAASARAMFAVQVGSFRSANNAERLALSLAERFAGVETTSTERDGAVFHRVRVVGFAESAAADGVVAELAALGYQPLRIRTSGPVPTE